MKYVAWLALFLSVGCFHGYGETVVRSQEEFTAIPIAQNETLIVDFIEYGGGYNSYNKNGVEYFIPLPKKGSAFTGPAELVFYSTVSYPLLITFHRVASSGITTSVFQPPEPGYAVHTIAVPANKTLKFFPLTVVPGETNFSIVKDGHTALISADQVLAGFELTGPLVLEIGVLYPPLVFSYVIAEDFVQLGQNGYLLGPAGTFEIVVEKSTDLTTWAPVMAQNSATSPSRSFYRLRVQK